MAARGTRSSRSEALLVTPPLDMTGGVMAGDSYLRELLRVCDRSPARLRSVPATERPIYQNLQAVRDRPGPAARLGTRPQTSRPRYVWCEGCDRRRGVGDLGWVKIASGTFSTARTTRSSSTTAPSTPSNSPGTTRPRRLTRSRAPGRVDCALVAERALGYRTCWG